MQRQVELAHVTPPRGVGIIVCIFPNSTSNPGLVEEVIRQRLSRGYTANLLLRARPEAFLHRRSLQLD